MFISSVGAFSLCGQDFIFPLQNYERIFRNKNLHKACDEVFSTKRLLPLPWIFQRKDNSLPFSVNPDGNYQDYRY